MDKQLVIDTIINWLPMLLVVAVWVFFMAKMMRPGGAFRKNQKEHMDLTRRQVEALERIATALEKKSS